MSVSGATPDAVGSVVQPLATVSPQQQTTGFHGYTPQQIQQAYGVSSLLSGGTDGTGKTIVIVDASYDPNITGDVAAFDGKFGLQDFNTAGGPSFKVVTSTGAAVTPENGLSLGEDANWSAETALDVEWAHAIAPGANIVLVETPVDADNNQQLNDLVAGVQYAATAGNVVSLSWGLSEFPDESSLDQIFQTAGNNVTFVAASGDSSAFAGPIWPATSPYVLAVGGSSLQATTSGGTTTYANESGWFGSGGGISVFESEPAFQTNAPSIGAVGGRLTPDVAFDANPRTGVQVYDSFGQSSPWLQIGGTSLGSPAWAGIVALADQQSGGSLNTNQVQTTLYNALSDPTTYGSTFHDITQGFNGYSATTGYNLVTGLGSPVANNLVPLLANTTVSSVSSANSSGGALTSAPPISSSPAHHHVAASFGNPGDSPVPPANPTPSSPIPAAPVVIIITLPINAPVAQAPVSTSAGINNVFASFNLTGQGTQPAAAAPSINPFVPASTPAAQVNTVFGASGFSRSNDSLRLSSLGLGSLGSEQMMEDLPGFLFEVQIQPKGDADADAPILNADADADASILDGALPAPGEGDAGDGGE